MYKYRYVDNVQHLTCVNIVIFIMHSSCNIYIYTALSIIYIYIMSYVHRQKNCNHIFQTLCAFSIHTCRACRGAGKVSYQGAKATVGTWPNRTSPWFYGGVLILVDVYTFIIL